MTVKEVINLMQDPTKEDAALVEKAYAFAETAHKDHTRYSGEPYFKHLFETAKTLAELGMGATTIAAGFLHDSMEDVGVKPETIEKEFGGEILFLIEGVTKLGKLKYRGAKRHTESLRKLFVATSEDIRVLIIKLCDRLHNMQTLSHVPPEKQKRIALETLEIYAPLAYRLGMRKFTRELEDLAFPYVYPAEYKQVKELLKKKTREIEDDLVKMVNSLKKELAKNGLTKFHSDYRIKSLYSLYKKLIRKEMDIEKIYDISAIRVIVESIADCYKVLGIIHGSWRPLPGRIKDYIAFPKPNGYRALHTTIFTGGGSIVEVQIRTEEMNREAEFGIASHLSYKGTIEKVSTNPNLIWLRRLLPYQRLVGKTPVKATFTDVPQWIKHLAQEQERSAEPKQFLKNLRSDFFEHRIFVFTPKGDVVDLPVHSSPIDFAYAIHSAIGGHMFGVKVNGKMAAIDAPLKNGDIVEILTRPGSKPSRKWLDVAKTVAARQHIRSALGLTKKPEPATPEKKLKKPKSKNF
jgi:GTP pyrophosphokinase